MGVAGRKSIGDIGGGVGGVGDTVGNSEFVEYRGDGINAQEPGGVGVAGSDCIGDRAWR